jgi:hypothetical protein
MNPILVILRPGSFENNGKYLLRVCQNNENNPVYIPVKFINYDACPALVVVRDSDGIMWRIPRDDVFSYQASIRD